MTVHLFTTWFTEYFKPTVKTYCSEKKKKILSKYYCSLTKYPITQELCWRCTMRLMSSSCPLTSILQPVGQGIVLTLWSYLRNIFHKPKVAVRQCDSSDGSGQSKLKTWKGFTILMLFFVFFFWLNCAMWNLSSPTRD